MDPESMRWINQKTDPLNIPDVMKRDLHGRFKGMDVKGLFYCPENIEYLTARVAEILPEKMRKDISINCYISKFKLPFFAWFKYRDPRDTLHAYNTTFIDIVKHLMCTSTLDEKVRVDNTTQKYGLTEDSFKGGIYTPEDYFKNNVYNKEPDWKRRIINTKTNIQHELKKAVLGDCALENPGGLPFYRLHPWRGKWNYDESAKSEGLDQGGEVDRFVQPVPYRYDMRGVQTYVSSTPTVPPDEIVDRCPFRDAHYLG